MDVTLIAAMTPDRVIGGVDGGVPWDQPRDREHFRRYTADKWMLIGRRTYEEMSGWFGTRTALVLTRRPDYQADKGHRVVSSVKEAIDYSRASGIRELVVGGGGGVFQASLPHASRLVLTTVETDIEGGAYFPECRNPAEWRLVHREEWPADDSNACDMILRILERTTAGEKFTRRA